MTQTTRDEYDIISKTDAWKKEDFRIRENAIFLKDKRIRAFGKFMKYVVFALAILSVLGGGVFGISLACENENKKEQARLDYQNKIDKEFKKKQDAYETTWVVCVQKLSLDECSLIRSVSFQRGERKGVEDYRRSIGR